MTEKVPVQVGDIGVTEHPYMYDRFCVVRVFKLHKTMWEVEQLDRHGEWAVPVRRKKRRLIPITGDPLLVRLAISEAEEAHAAAHKAADKKLWDDVTALAYNENLR